MITALEVYTANYLSIYTVLCESVNRAVVKAILLRCHYDVMSDVSMELLGKLRCKKRCNGGYYEKLSGAYVSTSTLKEIKLFVRV